MYEKGLLSRKAPLDWQVQVVVRPMYRKAVSYIAHCPKLVTNPGSRRIFDTLRQQY